MRTTLKDVALAAGVSVNTTSDILNGGDMRYSEQTRRRVEKEARRMNYRPNRQARILRGAKSGLIGMLKPVSVIQTAAERGLFAAEALYQAGGYDLISFDVHWHQQGLEHAVDFFLTNRVEGVLLVSLDCTNPRMQGPLRQLKKSGIPLVSVGGSRDPDISWVGTNYFQGGNLLGRHLVSQGLLKAAFLAGEEDLQFEPLRQRQAGLEAAFQQAGGTMDIVTAPIPGDFRDSVSLRNFASGQPALGKLLERKTDFDVAVCTNDYTALSVMRACRDVGIRIPKELAVTGFDDTAMGRFAIPRLTTVSQPVRAEAEKAVETLLEKMRGVPHPSRLTIRLDCKLVIRESCGTTLLESDTPSNTINPSHQIHENTPDIHPQTGNRRRNGRIALPGHRHRADELLFNGI